LIFAAFWGGMVLIGYVAVSGGDPNLLYYGFDSGGYLCGVKNSLWGDENGTVTTVPDFTSQKNVMYMDVTEYATMTLITPKSVCVETVRVGPFLSQIPKHTACPYSIQD
jgi:hypothetical protein|tara:strand:+ start:5207 stop:5533 length:327 start_codon:yes stop_codon:yes gene_type:complete